MYPVTFQHQSEHYIWWLDLNRQLAGYAGSCSYVKLVVIHVFQAKCNSGTRKTHDHSGAHLVFGTSSSIGEMGGREHWSNCSCSMISSPLDPYLRLSAQQTIGQSVQQLPCSSVNFLRVDTLAFLLALIPIYQALWLP